MEPTRLKSTLRISGIQQDNPALFQVIDQLIDSLLATNSNIKDVSARPSVGSIINNINSVELQRLEEFLVEESLGIPGPIGLTGPAGPAGASGTGASGGQIFNLIEEIIADDYPLTPPSPAISAAPAATIYRATAQAITQGVETNISFSNAAVDTSLFFDIGSPTRLTIPTGISGRFQISGQVNVALGADSGSVTLRIYKNTALVSESSLPQASGTLTRQITTQLDLVSGDYIELRILIATGVATSYNVTGGSNLTYFNLTKIGAFSASGGIGSSPLGGALILVEQHTIAGLVASVEFTFSATYDEYIFEFINIYPQTHWNGIGFLCKVGGAYDTAGHYTWVAQQSNTAGGSSVARGVAATLGQVIGGISTTSLTTGGACGSFKFSNPNSTTQYKILWGQATFLSGDGNRWVENTGSHFLNTGAVTNIKFFGTDNLGIQLGIIRMYGVAKV